MGWHIRFLLLLLLIGISTVFTAVVAAADEENAASPKPGPTLFLTSTEPVLGKESPIGKILVRELGRQAVLIAARDQLGLSTRDMTLREAMPEKGKESPAQLDVRVIAGLKSVQLTVSHGKTKIFDKTIEVTSPLGSFNYPGLTTALEEATAGELAEALRKTGFEGEPNPLAPATTVPAGIELSLSEMNFFSQYSAVRQLHSLQREKGESIQTLGALVRGYANLGQLTAFHWNASNKVFKARSLLYAEHLVKLDKASPWSLRHRAYSRALTGLHVAALEDLESAREQPGGKDSANIPAWEPLIDALCRYDGKSVEETDNAETRELSALVGFLIGENSQCTAQNLIMGRKALEVAPECYAICDSMARHKGVSNQHSVTVVGPQVLAHKAASRIAEMTGVPVGVRALVERAADNKDAVRDAALLAGPQRVALIAALVTGGAAEEDRAEPSWEVLGRLLEDVTFVHVYRRLAFFARGLGLPADSYRDAVQKSLDLIGDHPYRAVIECLPLNTGMDAAKIKKSLTAMKFTDVDMFIYPEVERYWNLDPKSSTPSGRPVWELILRHYDDIAQDCERVGAYSPDPRCGRWLQVISSYSPQSIVLMLTKDPTVSQSKMKQWEQQFGRHANVLMALSRRYLELKRRDDAERCLLQYARQSPDGDVYKSLASLYQQAGSTDKWKDALDESLKYEDFALTHARTRVTLAEYFKDREQWKEAVEYADAAAQTGAQWALQSAAECHEALEDWDAAEQLYHANAERYTGSEFDWYFWCRRTGHGDVEAAQRVAAKREALLALKGSPNNYQELGIYYLLADKLPLARSQFQRSFKMSGDLFAGLHRVLLCDEAKDLESRTEALRELLERTAQVQNPNAARTAEIALARWLNDAYDQAAESPPDVQVLEDALKPLSKPDLANMCYFIGRYFQLHGKPDLAKSFYQRCLQTHRMNKWNYTLAAIRLREM